MKDFGEHEPSSHLETDTDQPVTNINLDQLRYFLAAAEHLNYARAAQILGVYASTLSRQVRQLEDNLGVSLFERYRNGIRLTAAGRQFLVRAQRLMFDFSRAIASAAQAGRGEVGDLWLGVAPSMLLGPLRSFVRCYRLDFPQVELHCLETDEDGLVQALHERRIDVVVGYPDLMLKAGVRAMPLWSERLHIALPEGHPLAQRSALTWEHTANQTILGRRWPNPPDAYNEIARRLPSDTRIVQHPASRDSLFGLVVAGCGITIVAESATAIAYPGVVFRPVMEPGAEIGIVAAWLDDKDNPPKVRFIAGLRAFAKSQDRSAASAG
jgi:DNA-binding transcriptional LysR family regulator